MRFIECAQGTAEWQSHRCGKITASEFANAISLCSRKSGTRNVGEPTAAAERYAADLAIERINGKPYGEPVKTWLLERGHEMEFRARQVYEMRTGAVVTVPGLCVTDDGIFGYSSDGLIDDDGMAEIKAPIAGDKILAMWRTGDVSEYMHQIQGGMWITGRRWLDFMMYVPELASVGKDLFVKRIYRDEEFIDSMVERLAKFAELVESNVAVLRAHYPQEKAA